MYEKLNLASGGGIKSNNERSPQDNHTATIAIGIGGTGVSALKALKRTVYERLEPDNSADEAPVYQHIKFLAIDSDESKISDGNIYAEIDKQTEFFYIGIDNIATLLADHSGSLQKREDLKWFNYEKISIETAKNGAGGVRQVGRYLLNEKSAELKARITTLINNAIVGLSGIGGGAPDINIHIFAGISGGTGSGCFIDVCYIIREILRERGWVDQTNMLGFFFLPDVTLSNPKFPSGESHRSYIKVNGYASLMELDYLMGIESSGDKFENRYRNFSVVSKVRPVDLCHLISTTDVNGTVMPDGFNYVMNATAEYVLDYMTRLDVEGVKNANDLTLKGHISNLATLVSGMEKNHGANYVYNIIGASSAVIPYKQIATYLASRLFDKFEYIYNRAPDKAHVDAFVSAVQLKYNQIFARLSQRCTDLALSANMFDTKPLKLSNSILMSRINDWQDKQQGIIAENLSRLQAPLSGYELSDAPSSLIEIIFRELINNYVLNADYGPIYASKLLFHTSEYSLVNVLDALIAENRKRSAAEAANDQLRTEEFEKAEAGFKRSNVFNASLAKNKYIKEAQNYARHILNINKYNSMGALLKNLKENIENLSSGYFSVFAGTLNELRTTFRENAEFLAKNGAADTSSSYTWNIISVSDVADALDAEVDKFTFKKPDGAIVADKILYPFILTMVQHSKSWIGKDEAAIARMLSGFINEKFNDSINKTMMEFIKAKYNIANPQELKDLLRGEIIEKGLAAKANPVFYRNHMYPLSTTPKHSVISVPYNAGAVFAAAEEFANDGHITVRKTGLTDRIFMMHFYSGIPLYAYQALRELETSYKTNYKPGTHLYEKGKVNWKDMLPSIFPHSYLIDNYEGLNRVKDDRLKNMFEKAIDSGCIISEGGEYVIVRTKELDIDSLIENNGGILTNGKLSPSKAKDMAALLQKMHEQFHNSENIVSKILLMDNSHNAHAYEIALDNFIRYPIMNKLTEKELGKMETLKSKAEELNTAADKLSFETRRLDSFLLALYTSVIKVDRSRIYFKYKSLDQIDTTDLVDAEGKYSSVPLYQAYVSYCELAPDMLKKISLAVNKSVKDMTDTTYENAKKLRARFDSERINDDLSLAADYENQNQIADLYRRFDSSLNKFLLRYK